MFNNLIFNFCNWTPNHHAIEAIGHSIRLQFRTPYQYYEARTKESQLK